MPKKYFYHSMNKKINIYVTGIAVKERRIILVK